MACSAQAVAATLPSKPAARYGAGSPGSAEYAYEADAYDYEAEAPPPQSPPVSGPSAGLCKVAFWA